MQQLLRGISQDLERLQPHGNNNINGNGNGNGNGIYSSNGNGNGRSHARHSHVPVIITGDFNTTPNSSPCQVCTTQPCSYCGVHVLCAHEGARELYCTHAWNILALATLI